MEEREEWDRLDRELIGRALTEPEAFGALYDRYAQPIFGYCVRRTGDRQQAEDATSETFLRALEALPGYRGGSVRAWLFTIAHNALLNQARRRRELPLAEAAGIVDEAPAPAEVAERRDNRARLDGLLLRLSDDQRRVVELRLGGLTGREVADVLGRSEAAVKMLQSRALRRLRAELGSPGRSVGETDER